MKKEQKEAIALIFIITAIIISACVMLVVKPRMKSIAEIKTTMKKVNADIDKQRKKSRTLLELTLKKDQFISTIAANEAGLFTGITVGDLSRVVNTVLKNGYRNLKINYLGDRAEVLPGGRYNELTNELKIQNCDFHEAVKFISALETSNPGLRVTNLQIENAAVKSEGDGTVSVGIEVRLMGMHEGGGIPAEWEPPKTPAYEPAGMRNPFGIGLGHQVDPEQTFKDKAYALKITMNTADSVWVKDTTQKDSGARECLLKKNMPVFEPVKVRLVSIHEDYFTVQRDDGKSFKLVIRQANETVGSEVYERGTIRDVIEVK